MRKKRFLCLFLALTMVLSTMPYGVFAAEDNSRQKVSYEAEWTNPVYGSDVAAPETAGNTFSLRSADYYTTVEEAGAYLRQQMVNRETTVEFKFTSENFSKATFDVIYEEAVKHTGVPTEGDSLQFVCSGWAGGASGIVGEPYLAVTYNITYYTNEEQEFVATSEISDLKMNLEMDGKSDYEKVRAIYDYMTANIEYDYKNLNDESYTLKYTAYAALVKKTAVCQGYATLFYRLALSCGIDARVITGQSHGENHAWNIVKLDGKYYYLDSTWDSTWDADKTKHDYFLKGGENFAEHNADDAYKAAAFMEKYPMHTTDYVPGAEPEPEAPENPGDEPEDMPEGAKVTEGNFTAEIYSGEATITAYTGTDEQHVTVPAEIKGYPVKRVDYETFFDNDVIRSITFSEGIEALNGSCVSRCVSLTDVYLADTVSIDKKWSHSDNCFFEVPKLKKIHISDEHLYMTEQDDVFYSKDMKKLIYYPEGRVDTSLVIPDGVVKICSGAFEHSTIKKVVIPDSVKTIGAFAFSYSALEEASIGSGCEYIGQWAFTYTNLETIALPASVEIIITPAFVGHKLKSIEVDAGNEKFYAKDGVLYTRAGGEDMLLCYPGQKPESTYVLPTNITRIDEYAFAHAVHLANVELNNKITYIPGHAFFYCTNLESIEIPDSVTRIYEYAFSDCNKLGSVTMPPSVTKIEDDAFANVFGFIVFGEEGSYAETYGKKHYEFYPIGTTIIKKSFGDHMTWTLDLKDKRVTVEGEGVCEGMGLGNASNLVTEIVFSDGITKVCNSSFPFMYSLKRVVFSESVTAVENVYFGEGNYVESMYFENDTCEITDLSLNPFSVCAFYGNANTTVEEYAKAQGIPYYVHNPSAHTYSEWYTLEAATCKEEGKRCKNCVCGERQFETIPISGHTERMIPETPATCTDPGLSEGTYCVVCNVIVKEQIETNPLGHDFRNYESDENATCVDDGTKTAVCERCPQTDTIVDVGSAKKHSEVLLTGQPASFDDPGLSEGTYCAVCGKILVEQKKIPAISTVKLSYDKTVYTGKTIKAPSLIVTDSTGKALIPDTDYTVTGLTDQKEVGRYKVTVTFKGNYIDSKELSYTIVPKKTTSAKAVLYGYDDVQFSWSKAAGASGYLVYYKKGSGSWSKAVATTKTYYKKAKLSDGVKYTFKVVPYYKTKTSATKYYDANQYKTAYTYTLKKVTGVKVTKSGTKVKVSWSNISGETGYQISKMTSSKAIQKKPLTYKTTSGKYKKLSATRGKTYYYRVRAYKVVNGKSIYGPWSGSVKYKRK